MQRYWWVRARGNDWAQDRKLPSLKSVRTSLCYQAPQLPEPCLPAHMSQTPLLQSLSSHGDPLHQQGPATPHPFLQEAFQRAVSPKCT